MGTLDLILDIGNTRTKLAIYQGGRALSHQVIENGDTAAIEEFLGGAVPDAITVGSTANPDPATIAQLRQLAPVLVLSGDSLSPLQVAYGTRHTLGADRLANAVAAVGRFPGRPILVIDAGTCITYDLCEAEGTYRGGAISPGMHMRSKAMYAYSARLPKVDPDPSPEFLGETTEDSLAAGMHFGILGEMEGFIRRLGKERPGMVVVITGGDAVRFVRGLESGIFALPYLTLEGYHALLQHHRALTGGVLPFGTAGSSGTSPAG
ncbi:MAG: type III pantothenate kinase [Flavobacteriales bacterium]|nr:type III pantothenate kinase [Flavobacteriales bacterium]